MPRALKLPRRLVIYLSEEMLASLTAAVPTQKAAQTARQYIRAGIARAGKKGLRK